MELEEIIDMLIKEKGGTRRQYHLLMDKIGNHESHGDPYIHQIGGGPGRGYFQFEIGENKGGKTAANRLITYLKRNNKQVPEWLNNTRKSNSLDASKFTPAQQKMLFLGSMREHPKANFSKVWEGKETEEDFWAKYHWSGKKKDEFKRRRSFRESLKTFKPKEYPERAENVPEQYYPWSQSKVDYSGNKIEDQTSKPLAAAPTNYKLDLMKFDLSKPKNVNHIQQPQESSYTQYANNHNIAAMGGTLDGNNEGVGEFNEFKGGGTHEQNPLGGIPLGQDSQGVPNSVEEDETSYKFKEGKYIFSNRIKL